jgi:hypothetical protein
MPRLLGRLGRKPGGTWTTAMVSRRFASGLLGEFLHQFTEARVPWGSKQAQRRAVNSRTCA